MTDAGAVARAAELAALGHRASLDPADHARLVVAITGADDPRARAAALGALARVDPSGAFDSWQRALDDPAPAVRRRAADTAPDLDDRARVAPSLVALLDDAD